MRTYVLGYGSLMNGTSAASALGRPVSDSDLIPAVLRGYRRTAGMRPEAGSASIEGEWIIEGYGVDPDIVVENDPKSVLAGRDPQLERGVAEVMKKMEVEPRKLPKKPAGPDKTQAGVEAAGRQ